MNKELSKAKTMKKHILATGAQMGAVVRLKFWLRRHFRRVSI